MMRSATAFLPDSMITFMNLDRSTEPNFGSGRISRLGTSRRRGISLFLLLQLAPAHRRSPRVTTDIWGRPTYLTSPSDRPPVDSQAFFGRLAPYFERDCLRSLT